MTSPVDRAPRRPSWTMILGSALLSSLACRGPVHGIVPTEDPGYPRLRFLDGSVSVNDRCPVSGTRLNPRMDPLYVNGRPIGFC